MILFVFEGDEREPRLYRTLERLYFPKVNDNIICSFGNNIYDLYNELKEYEDGGDIVSVMRERLAARGDSTLNGMRSSDISEIFLFFDYDFQNSHLSLEEINRRVEEMNVSKANLLIAGLYTMPKDKSVVNQLSIFERQLLLHVKPNRSVAVLNSFPIFIYEYMK
uniref:hypothetical protein n=1 Tax=Prevotella sp. TaxID=59823 RepID=UPI003FEF5371